MKYNADEFYPTPPELLAKITEGFDWSMVSSILEPSAGTGNIVDYCMDMLTRSFHYRSDIDIDCIEIDSDLQKVLTGKGYRLIHDDFLTFSTFKRYDLIFMNPPFSNGAAHLMHALDMQKHGGNILCILNAETLRNPYTNERKDLCQRLDALEATITYMDNAFATSERPTNVEIAVIQVAIPARQRDSEIFNRLVATKYPEPKPVNLYELAPNDFIEAAIRQYRLETEAGMHLIEEYQSMKPHILSSLKETTYNSPILALELGGRDASINGYVRAVRSKYWEALFHNKKFTGSMTSNLAEKYYSRIRELADYDFSSYNIHSIQLQIRQELTQGIEECIVELFDELSHQYSYSDETKRNIHYYNGWKTNKSWIINKKVILPWMQAFGRWDGSFDPDYRVKDKLADIERALNYLDGGRTGSISLFNALDMAHRTGQTKKIRLKYFYVTFYKKGTCHIEFTDDELLKKLNIFGCQQKGWLPPAYGKQTYWQMSPEERQVVNEFEGMESYANTLANKSYFIYDPKNSIPLIGMESDNAAERRPV